CDQFVNLPVEVAAARETLPQRREPVLPGDHGSLGSAAMLQKDEMPARSQYSPHFLKSLRSIRNGTQGPREDHRIDAGVSQRQWLLGGLREKLDRNARSRHPLARHLLELHRRVHAVDALDLRRIESQVQPRANTDLEHFPARSG